jgi:predicted dehydrogenase
VAGTGRIARKLVPEFQHVPGAELVAIGSRSQQRADEFARDYGIARSYGTYAALLADPSVDVVYVATPSCQHYAIALQAIRVGKGVLVEKAFTSTLAGATEVVAESRRRKVFAMEAMWTRFLPAVIRAHAYLADRAIGEIISVQSDLGVTAQFDPSDSLFDPALGGGALLNLAVYGVSFAQMILGQPQSVSAVGKLEGNAVDASTALLLGWRNGSSATISTSLHSPMPGAARVFGTDGWLDVPPLFVHPDGFVLHRNGHEAEVVSLPPVGFGYAHELIEVTECIRTGKIESTIMPLDDTLAVMSVLHEATAKLGITRTEDSRVMAG